MTEKLKVGQIVIVAKEATGIQDLTGQIKKIEFHKVIQEELYTVRIAREGTFLNVRVLGKFLSYFPDDKKHVEEIIKYENSSNRSTTRIVIEHYVIILLLASLALNIYLYREIKLLEKVAYKLLDENEVLIEQRNSDLWKKLRENNSKKP
jgi:hypothetical protein